MVIETNEAVPRDIAIRLHGENVGNLSKPGAINLHLGLGENLFTLTLDTNQINAWNTNTRSATPGVDGFEIRDGTTVLEHIHDQNQFFTGRGEVKETIHLISPDRTETATVTLANDGDITISYAGTPGFRLSRQMDGTVDLAVTGTLQANQTIT